MSSAPRMSAMSAIIAPRSITATPNLTVPATTKFCTTRLPCIVALMSVAVAPGIEAEAGGEAVAEEDLARLSGQAPSHDGLVEIEEAALGARGTPQVDGQAGDRALDARLAPLVRDVDEAAERDPGSPVEFGVIAREFVEQAAGARQRQVVRGLVRLLRVGAGHHLHVPGREPRARLDHRRHGPVDPAVADDGQRGAQDDREEREQAARAVAEQPLQEEADHVILPRNASVGLSLAIRRVGRNETMAVVNRTRPVVPATSATLYAGKRRSPMAKP